VAWDVALRLVYLASAASSALIAGWALIGFLGASCFRFCAGALDTDLNDGYRWHSNGLASIDSRCQHSAAIRPPKADRIISTTGLDAVCALVFWDLPPTCLDASVQSCLVGLLRLGSGAF